ncbi:MAG: class I SAM-dependent methyltransferase, partial [Candidatus Glassbacteria bacterium]
MRNIMAWYKRAFSHTYLDVYSHRDEDDARRALELVEKTCFRGLSQSRRQRSLVLDLCCGEGRYTLLLARQGHRVVGMDLSGELLEKARERLLAEPDLAGRVWFVRADMCCIPSAGAFDLAINMFTSFGYFDQDRQNFEVLR